MSEGGSTDREEKPGSNAWVQCDKCEKWRRISRAASEALGDDAWYCHLNADTRFSSCEQPQELSDVEIDKLLAAEDGGAPCEQAYDNLGGRQNRSH
eukprot:54765-Prorocentrum_minimum.AAC.2